jgi:hypothetical protein
MPIQEFTFWEIVGVVVSLSLLVGVVGTILAVWFWDWWNEYKRRQ